MSRPELETFEYKYGFSDSDKPLAAFSKGLSKEVVAEISALKGEDAWMRDFRMKAFGIFKAKSMPEWGADLSGINFDEVVYFVRPAERQGVSWDEVPPYIKKTFERLGIPEAERKYLAGVSAQYDSEVVYHSIKSNWEKKGVIFSDTDTAYKKYPEIFRKYFGMVIPPADNKLSALNSAVWSGGSFVYVPKGVKVEIPLQAYFRINAKNMGQFERTLIIAEPGSSVHYIEGCTAPTYSSDSLHSAVVELIAMEGSRIQYTTIQNWSNNVYNLVTKRAFAYKDATVFWVDGNLGSKITMKYPSVYLMGEGAKAEILSVAFAGKGQHQDAGGKILHYAPNTTSRITSKSVSKDGGRTTYRGLIHVAEGCKNVKSHVTCDALILDEQSASDTVPYMEINEKNVNIEHEATVGKIGDEQLFYLMSRGLSQDQAMTMIVSGFMQPFTKELPLEYAIELNRLIAMNMEGSVG